MGLNKVVQEGFSEELICKQRPEGNDGSGHVKYARSVSRIKRVQGPEV